MVNVWQTENALKCPGCGRYDWEQEEDPDAWVPGIHLCVFCAAVETFKEDTVRDREGLASEGFKVRLYRGSDNNGD